LRDEAARARCPRGCVDQSLLDQRRFSGLTPQFCNFVEHAHRRFLKVETAARPPETENRAAVPGAHDAGNSKVTAVRELKHFQAASLGSNPSARSLRSNAWRT
jgi:hypothetical protein